MRTTVLQAHDNITLTEPLRSSALAKATESSKVTKPNPLDLPVSRSVIIRAVNKTVENQFSGLKKIEFWLVFGTSNVLNSPCPRQGFSLLFSWSGCLMGKWEWKVTWLMPRRRIYLSQTTGEHFIWAQNSAINCCATYCTERDNEKGFYFIAGSQSTLTMRDYLHCQLVKNNGYIMCTCVLWLSCIGYENITGSLLFLFWKKKKLTVQAPKEWLSL